MVFNFFRKDPRRAAIATLYERVASASRAQGLYTELGVPDTLEGRFESLSLHMILALRAFRILPSPADEIAGDLTDAFFQDLDGSMREMGVGDTVIGKKVKKLASNFYGRAHAYDEPLDKGDEATLAQALGRNVLGGDQPAHALARYVRAADHAIRQSNLETVLEQGFDFPKPDAFLEAKP